MKRYKHTNLLRTLKDILRTSKAAKEWETTYRFFLAGIKVPRPLALGERRRLRFLRESFLLCEEVPGSTNLGLYALNFRSPLSRDKLHQKRQLITLLARAIRRAQGQGVWHDDLKASNIVVKEDDLSFYFIDLDGAKLRKKLSLKEKVEELRCLHESLAPFINRTDKMRFLKEYTGGEPAQLRSLLEKIKHFTAL